MAKRIFSKKLISIISFLSFSLLVIQYSLPVLADSNLYMTGRAAVTSLNVGDDVNFNLDMKSNGCNSQSDPEEFCHAQLTVAFYPNGKSPFDFSSASHNLIIAGTAVNPTIERRTANNSEWFEYWFARTKFPCTDKVALNVNQVKILEPTTSTVLFTVNCLEKVTLSNGVAGYKAVASGEHGFNNLSTPFTFVNKRQEDNKIIRSSPSLDSNRITLTPSKSIDLPTVSPTIKIPDKNDSHIATKIKETNPLNTVREVIIIWFAAFKEIFFNLFK